MRYPLFLFTAASLMAVQLAHADALKLPASVVAKVRAVINHAQPDAEFGSGPDILIASYRTANHVFAAPGADGRKAPPIVELGPLHGGGFYLQIVMEKKQGRAAVQYEKPSKTQPWITVISTYPIAHRGQMIVMTWEATAGLKPDPAAPLRAALLHYAANPS